MKNELFFQMEGSGLKFLGKSQRSLE